MPIELYFCRLCLIPPDVRGCDEARDVLIVECESPKFDGNEPIRALVESEQADLISGKRCIVIGAWVLVQGDVHGVLFGIDSPARERH